MQDVLDAPILVGRLNKKQGLNGFVPAEVGHPVFEYKDRYLIFLKCLTKTAEQVPDGNGGHTKHMIQYVRGLCVRAELETQNFKLSTNDK